MKRLIAQLALLIAVLSASVQAHAYDCVVNGIYYNLNSSNNTAEVTRGEYEGAIAIPESITCNGSSYSVTSIGGFAFTGCTGLTSVTIGNSVTSIGEYAFYNCTGLTSVTIPNSVTTIGEGAFSDCSGLTSVTIPNSVTSIGGFAFTGCTGLISVTIGNSVTSIGDYAFQDCDGLMSMTIPNSVTSIGEGAFSGCSGLISVTIGNSVTSIGEGAFDGCIGLISVTIGNSVTSIGNYAFYGCRGLTSVTISESVTSIGNSAFRGCSGLKRLTCLAPNPPTCGDSAFNGVDRTRCTLYVLEESVNVYKIADQWKDFYNVVGLLGVDDITMDGDDAETLYDVYNMQGVKVGSGLRRADMSDALPHGIYILVSPNATRKIRL